jgi:hypothetical protein
MRLSGMAKLGYGRAGRAGKRAGVLGVLVGVLGVLVSVLGVLYGRAQHAHWAC